MNTPPSPLGTLALLPPELRALIYKAALTSPNPIQITRYHHSLIPSNPANPPVTEPKKSGKAVTHRTAKNEFGPQSRVVLAHPTKPKCKQKLPAAEVFAMGLVGTSKAVRDEAMAVLYGANTFEFENEYAIEAFMGIASKQSVLLKHVRFAMKGIEGREKQVRMLSRLAAPKRVEIRLCKAMYSPESAAKFADVVWKALKDVLQTQLCFDLPGWDWLRVPLPLELQLRRFAGVRFEVPEGLEFAGVEGEGSAARVIRDEGERARRFRALIEGKLVGEAERERKMEKARKKVLAEKLRVSETLRAV